MTNLLYVPNPLLRQKAEKIKFVGSDEVNIAKKMMDIMLKAPGVGLAANQIGILKQIVTIFFIEKDSKKEIQYTLYNPKIISYSSEIISMEEGGLSLPEQVSEFERQKKITRDQLDKKNK